MQSSQALSIDLPLRPAQESYILVVDDDQRIVEMLKDVLSIDGYQINTALDGESALKALREQHTDLVVLDVRMPGRDGIEVCREIKADPQHHYVPVILLTGFDERERRLSGLRAGADDFLSKPVDPVELQVRARSLIRSKQLREEVDIHRRELELRVAERTEQLQKALTRLEELTEVKRNVMALILHELRTPLLQARDAQKLLEETEPDPETRRRLHATLAARLNLLVYRIRDVELAADPGDLTRGLISVADLVRGATNEVEVLSKPLRFETKLDIPKGLPPIEAHAAATRRALAHVIHNAAKFGEYEPVEIKVREEQRQVLIEVGDRGPGIPAELRPHLFDPITAGNQSATREKGGMGIGLTVTKLVLDAQHASIELKDREGGGTLVCIRFPAAALPAGANREAGKPA